MNSFDRKIDATDRKLLMCLLEDARLPVTELAKRIGLSRGSTQDRLRRLERDGVILGYTLRLRGFESAARAWLLVSLAPGVNCGPVTARISAMLEVTACYSVTGAIDVVALVAAPDIDALSSVREAIASIPGVATVQTHTILTEHRADDAVGTGFRSAS